jgi:sarcosine oxidase
MQRTWDVVVAGLGAMGSATLYELARRGRRVLGLDRFAPPHAWGSSHGETRIIREAYFEHPQYVPLVRRAYASWDALALEADRRLLVRTGGLMIGPRDGVLVRGALASAHQHGLDHEMLTAAEVARRHPALRPHADMTAVWEPRAGVLFPERCIEAHLNGATGHGAELRTSEPLVSWRATSGNIEVTTASGAVSAGALVLACGAWMPQVVPELGLPLSVERTVLHWFAPHTEAAAFGPDRLPIFLLEYAPDRFIYGMPELSEVGEGVKVARHHEGEITSADSVRREVAREEIEAMAPLVEDFTPGLSGGWRRSAVCMYTNTPDQDFIIDCHPAHPNVVILSPCSGHGFKFSCVIGEIAADLVTRGATAFDLEPFRLGRWSGLSASGLEEAAKLSHRNVDTL